MAIFKELPILDSIRENEQSPLSELSITGLSNPSRPMNPAATVQIPVDRKPPWIRIRPPGGENYLKIKSMLDERNLHTVCQEAHCPNLTECWSGGTATFMLGSDTCTRACRFCAVKTARIPPPLDPNEPEHIAKSIVDLNLKYVVLTSVDRDDLKDGGATHFAKTIEAIKKYNPEILVEALVPDFKGDTEAIKIIVDSGLDVYAHNIETVARLQYRVRDPRANYIQSLTTLKYAKEYTAAKSKQLYTKSSIMLGLGESEAELEASFADLREFNVDILTLGQYLRPSLKHLPVDKYYSPEEFKSLELLARKKDFLYVASGPMVRSSYKAAEFFIENKIRSLKNNH